MPCKLRRISLGAGNKREQLIKSHFSPSKGYDGSQFLNILSFNFHTSKLELPCPRSQRLVSMWPRATDLTPDQVFSTLWLSLTLHTLACGYPSGTTLIYFVNLLFWPSSSNQLCTGFKQLTAVRLGHLALRLYHHLEVLKWEVKYSQEFSLFLHAHTQSRNIREVTSIVGLERRDKF